MLVRGRQREPLAEVLRGFVGGEAGPDRRNLEEHAARFSEVDRAEVEAVDHRRGGGAGRRDPLLPVIVVVHRRRPGDVVDGSRSTDAALLGPVEDVAGAALLAAHFPVLLAAALEAERLFEEAAALLRVVGVGADRLEPLQRVLARNLGVVRDQRLVRGSDHRELVREPFGIGEEQRAGGSLDRDPLAAQTLLPEAERLLGGNPPDDTVHHPGARAPAPRVGVLEGRDVATGLAALVGVEEVVDGRVVLVDALLHEPQPEHPRVEVDVARRVPRDRRDVVDPLELHGARLAPRRLFTRRVGRFLAMRGNGRLVYDFDEPSEGGRELLGGKGIGLAEMTQLGVPVPAGFTVTTDACRAYVQNGKTLPEGLEPEIAQHLDALEQKTGKRFGDPDDPLLVSVRSGAAVSMPGMMDTILNLGLNDEAVEGLGSATGNQRFAYDSYRRLIQMYGEVVEGVDAEYFERALRHLKEERGAQQDV